MTMFTKRQCGEAQLYETNRFSALKGKWTTDEFLDPRMENFYGCQLSIKLGHNELPFLKWEVGVGGKILADGVLVKTIEELSVLLNFKINFTTETVCDLLLDTTTITVEDEYVQPSSNPIFSTSDVFIVPPGESYTPWEKLLLPFDKETWMWLGITFTIASLVVLLILLQRSNSMYDFVIGLNVATPYLNIIGIFMGVSQNVLPHRNVSRFLFTSFILFCLIMRTAYQGKYFEFITGDVRKKPITSIEELKEKNMDVYFDYNKYFFQDHTVLDNLDTYAGSDLFLDNSLLNLNLNGN